jgi:hypothetical protein
MRHASWMNDSSLSHCEGVGKLRSSLAQSRSHKYDPTAFEELPV